jgi:OFA family oxalate/formate antiporter-like MFS transporter
MSVPTLSPPPRIFYGWYILGVAMLGAFLAAGTSQLYLSIMLKPLADDLGWSRTATTVAITIGTVLGGLLSPFVGRLADRYGPRLLATLGALILTVTYFGLAGMTELWEFYVIYIVGRGLTTSMLSGVVPFTAAANWFRRMRGRALGLIAMCVPLGGSALSLVGQLIIEGPGWRTVFLVFGITSLVLLVLPAALILRRRPEEMGLLPDGALPSAEALAGGPRPRRGDEFGWTLGEALHTPALWLLGAAATVAAMANTAVGFHQVAYYTDVGIAPTEAVAALSLYALCGALASGLWGWLTERFSERGLAVASVLASAGAILYLLTVRSLAGALIFAVLFGVTARGGTTLVNIILAQYYGRESFGAISGFMTPFVMVGLGLGPAIGAYGFDLTDSYQTVFTAFAVLSVLVAGLLWLAKKPALPPRAARR